MHNFADCLSDTYLRDFILIFVGEKSHGYYKEIPQFVQIGKE